jgi:hypothetical protein
MSGMSGQSRVREGRTIWKGLLRHDWRAIHPCRPRHPRSRSGAYRRAAPRTGVRLSLIGDALDRVEASLGYRLLEQGAGGRRKAVLTAAGEQRTQKIRQYTAAAGLSIRALGVGEPGILEPITAKVEKLTRSLLRSFVRARCPRATTPSGSTRRLARSRNGLRHETAQLQVPRRDRAIKAPRDQQARGNFVLDFDVAFEVMTAGGGISASRPCFFSRTNILRLIGSA